MRILLMGPPGSGKGTQAALLAERLGVPAISTGEIFRSNIADRTDLGLAVQSYIERGAYVPDETTDTMVRNRLAERDCKRGFILDGYPRTLAQVGTLDTILADQGTRLDAVVALHVATAELTRRLLFRAELERRADDTEEVIQHRLALYDTQTASLLASYQARRLLAIAGGERSVTKVAERIDEALAVLARRPR